MVFRNQKKFKIRNAWINDLYLFGYTFPIIISSSSCFSSITYKRVTICVTGLTECIEEAWIKNYLHIRNILLCDIDTFIFLSSSINSGPIPLPIRLKEIYSYMTTTITIIYEDRNISVDW
jgi:hypothetical protein